MIKKLINQKRVFKIVIIILAPITEFCTVLKNFIENFQQN